VKKRRMVRRVLAAAAFLAVLVVLAACQKQPPETMLQPPIEGLTWGMTQDEVLEVLHLQAEEFDDANATESTLNLNYALAGLGTDLHGIPLTAEDQSVQLHFNEYLGVRRLSTVTLYVHAKNGPALKEALSSVYGEPYEGEQTLWSGTNLQKDAAGADVEKLDEYDRGTLLAVAGGKQKLFAVRPYLTVYTNTDLPPLKLNQSYDFLLMYRADAYLKSQYGSEPIGTIVSLKEPVQGLVMGMSRLDFAELIGSTEDALLAKNKREILLDYTALGMKEPEFLGFELCPYADGTMRELRISFTDNGDVVIVQAAILAESPEEVENRLTRMYGDPEEAYTPQWYAPDASDDAFAPFVTYMENGAVINGQRVFTLFVNANLNRYAIHP